MKITIGTQDGQTFQKELNEASPVFGKQIGDSLKGEKIGLTGYKLEITGGSDRDGFPMKKSYNGTERKKVLLEDGVGLSTETKGERQRKSVRGNTVSNQIEQLNTKVTEAGEEPVEEILDN